MDRKIDPRFRPELIAKDAYIAPNATVRGDVTLGQKSSVWFGAVVRGDTESVTIGDESNIQDLSVLHADPGFPCKVGDRVTVGHGAIVHGATVESESLIGMRAVILNGARIGKGSVVGAGALVGEGKEIPAGSLAVGVPARIVRQLSEEDQQRIARGSEHYVASALAYANEDQTSDND